MRVGLVCPYDLSKPGGVQSQVLGLRRALVDDDVVVFGPGLPAGVPGWDLGPTVGVPANGSVAPISVNPRVGRVIRSAAGEVDVLHVHEPFMPTVGLSALRAGPPVVATFHAAATGIGRRFYNLLGGLSRNLLGSQVRAVTAVSKTAAAALPKGLDPVIIPNGLDTAAFEPTDGDRGKRVVFLGRDEPRKGLGVLLEAWPVVVDAVPDARLTVMGSDRGGIGVEWLGIVDDETKARVLRSAAVYVAPNTGSESFGIIVIEAMAAGAAVVASDLRAFVDVGGDAALYFPAGDAEALAAAVIGLLEDERTRSNLSAAGVARATRYDWSVIAARYRSVYGEAVS